MNDLVVKFSSPGRLKVTRSTVLNFEFELRKLERSHHQSCKCISYLFKTLNFVADDLKTFSEIMVAASTDSKYLNVNQN